MLDGVLYHESDLDLEEHYTDTHGYTEINFAAFGMVSMRFCLRIRSLHRQRIYCADPGRDHGVLEPVLKRGRQAVNFRLIAEQWDRIGQFYAAFPAGHATASAALQRLNRFQASNRFYVANRELGRALKTAFVLAVLFRNPSRKSREWIQPSKASGTSGNEGVQEEGQRENRIVEFVLQYFSGTHRGRAENGSNQARQAAPPETRGCRRRDKEKTVLWNSCCSTFPEPIAEEPRMDPTKQGKRHLRKRGGAGGGTKRKPYCGIRAAVLFRNPSRKSREWIQPSKASGTSGNEGVQEGQVKETAR